MRDLFFVSKQPQRGAGVVAPGGWGSVYSQYSAIRRTSPGGDPWQLILELTIENERLVSFPHLPSRFTCAFAFLSLEAAMAMNGPGNFGDTALAIWACETLEPDATSHIGKFPSLGAALDGLTFGQIREIAAKYWREVPAPAHQEFLTNSPLRLTRRLYDSAPGSRWIESRISH